MSLKMYFDCWSFLEENLSSYEIGMDFLTCSYIIKFFLYGQMGIIFIHDNFPTLKYLERCLNNAINEMKLL